MTLTDFLLARVAEDEASLPSGFDCWYKPERYVAECAAKRAIVELHEDVRGSCMTCGAITAIGYKEDWPCDTIKALAQPYADHPDFDEAWRLP